MRTVEDRVAAAMLSAARKIDDVPPLRLPPSPAGPHRARRRPRRVLSWAVPLAAAAMVAVVAAGLVTLRGMQHGHGAPAGAPDAAGVPRYYAALVQAGASGPEQVQVRETLTGHLIATVRPPAGSTFAGITGAADDRTWVLDTQQGVLTGPDTADGQSLRPRSWYLLRISPGSPGAPRLTRLSIPPTAQGTEVDAIALSPDGTQLAVAYLNAARQSQGWPPWLSIYSVATGTQVRQWAANFGQHFGTAKHSGPDRNLALAWTKDGSALVYGYATTKKTAADTESPASPGEITSAQIRVLPTHSGGADLDLASKPVLSLATTQASTPGTKPSPLRCGLATLDQIVLATDRGTLVCAGTGRSSEPGPLNARSCTAGPPWNRLGLLEYSITSGLLVKAAAQFTSACTGPQVQVQPLWSSADGTTQLGLLGLGPSHPASPPAFGMFRDGTFTRLPFPPAGRDGAGSALLNYIAW